MEENNKRIWGYTAVALAACFFALISILTKFAYRLGITPLQLLTLQSGLAAIILVSYCVLRNPQVLRLNRELVPKLIVHSVVGSLGTSFLVSYALVYLPASLAIMLLFIYPVLVTLGAYLFFREKIKPGHLAALGLAMVGIFLSTQLWQISPSSLQFKGILIGIGSAVAYAFFNLFGEHLLDKLEPLAALAYVQIFSSIGLLLYQLFGFGDINQWVALGLPQLLICLALATIASIIPFWLLLEGIKQIGATKASIIATLELPVTFILAYFLLAERFSTWQGAGAILIVSSVILVRLQSFKQPKH